MYKEIKNLGLKLALKEPGVEIAHQLCISSIVWEIPNHCINKTLMPYTESQWVRGNDLYLKENSQFPYLVPWLSNILLIQKLDPFYNGLLSPSIYFFLTIFISLFAAIRLRIPKIVLYSLPSFVQSAVLAVINISDNFRYQYGVYIIGLFSLGLLFCALTQSRGRIPDLKSGPPLGE